VDVSIVWSRLAALEGEEFRTATGLPFTYTIDGDVFHSSRAKQEISKLEFEKAIGLGLPIDGPGAMNQLVRGPAYIWAVLHDPRVRKTDR
jgi:hypothetical protein